MAIGKTLRFEIFARDGFACQYCGKRPPDVVLELDHLHPRAKGGSDDPLNLITACFDCNRGKRDKVLSEMPRRPDADLKFLELQQEIAEAKRYLKAKKQRDKMHSDLADELESSWAEWIRFPEGPSHTQFLQWLAKYGAEEVETAIKLCSPRVHAGQFGGMDTRWGLSRAMRYVSGILRTRADEREPDAEG